jgi:hypothetical protein
MLQVGQLSQSTSFVSGRVSPSPHVLFETFPQVMAIGFIADDLTPKMMLKGGFGPRDYACTLRI